MPERFRCRLLPAVRACVLAHSVLLYLAIATDVAPTATDVATDSALGRSGGGEIRMRSACSSKTSPTDQQSAAVPAKTPPTATPPPTSVPRLPPYALSTEQCGGRSPEGLGCFASQSIPTQMRTVLEIYTGKAAPLLT